MSGTKLELTWPGKQNRPRLEPRILVEEPGLSYHVKERVTEGDVFDNVLIQGDNLLALKAMEAEYEGKVKCIFIDPPYNTGSAFEHYDDGLEHSLWLSMMKDRLYMLKSLLASDGSIWIAIDDNEMPYLKVVCDEVFGRQNFVANIVWQHSIQGKNDSKLFSLHHNYVLCYRRSPDFVLKKLPRKAEHNVAYSNPDNDPRGAWRSGDVRSPNFRANLRFKVKTPSGKVIEPPEKGWRWQESTFMEKVATGEISFVDNDSRVLRKIYLEDQEDRVAETIWFGQEVGTSREASIEVANLVPAAVVFATPKPERLLERVLILASNPGDLILDSFAGSGTTGAVAQKMGRRWILVELGVHAVTHIVPRMRKVADGTDQGGISKAVAWKGGGGFRFYRLAPSLLKEDRWGHYVINPVYNAEMLARAVCLHEGFAYAPSETEFWIHGRANESSYLYVTTQHLRREQLQALSNEVGPGRSLRILCAAFSGGAAGRRGSTTWR